MLALFPDAFSNTFIPHGHCYLWKPGLVGLHVVSDALIALSYYSIPLILVYFVRQRRDLPFHWIFLWFGGFIIACGTGHLLDVWTLWHPNYWVSGIVKAITAGVSVLTVFQLVPLIPLALALPSPTQLEETNRQLEKALEDRTTAEAKLQIALQRLTFHVENTPLAVIECDSQFRVQWWSPQAEHLFGWKAEEVVNRHINDLKFVCDEDQEIVASAMQELTKASSPRCVCQNRNYTKEGAVVHCEWYNSSLCDENGNLVSILSLALDVTSRKQAEASLQQAKVELEARVEKRTSQLKQVNEHLVVEIQDRQLAEESLRKSEARLNLALSAAQMSAWDWDMISDRINWSEGVETLLGRMPGTPLDTYGAFLECLHPEDRAVVEQTVIHAVKTGTDYEIEVRTCWLDGTTHWIASKGAVLRNHNGQALRMTGTVMDITERKQVELALERERQQLRQIITHAPVAMAMFDRQMRYLAHSDKWIDFQGLEAEASIIGRNHYELVLDIPEHWKAIHQQALQGAVLSASEDVWERADETKIYLRWAIHPWYTPEGNVGGIVIATDKINELVEAREAALEASRLKSEFLANMSHEIRTPMNGVLGMAGLLLQTSLTRQQLDYAHTIRSSAEHLLKIINDILDFSKLEAGEMSLETLDFNLEHSIDAAVNILAAQAEEKGLDLAAVIDPDVPRQLQGDPGRLRQILLNLVGNAIKFTEAGSVVVKASVSRGAGEQGSRGDGEQGSRGAGEQGSRGAGLRTHRLGLTDSDSVSIRFEVTDTGIGICAADRQKLFQSFSQVDASMTRQYDGTGLGLVICKQLVELMGGEIGVESKPGQGSTFWFTMPFNPATVLVGRAVPQSLNKLKLLIVTDHGMTRQAVRSLVDAWGMHLDEVTDSTATLNALRTSAAQGHPYDVAIVDLQLSQHQGALLVPMVRRDPTLAATKLIVLTTRQQRDSVQDLEEIGISGCIIKPIRASLLFDSLVTAMAPLSPLVHPLEPSTPQASPSHPSLVKILLVEDHPVNQMVILNQLQMLGYQADCMSNGAEAIAHLQSQPYDIVLMDCQMPVLDGYKATQEIRRREGANQHTVIIALTAHALPSDRAKCLAAGMDDYLSKPIAQEALGAILERWIPETPTGKTQKQTHPLADNPALSSQNQGMAIASNSAANPQNFCYLPTAVKPKSESSSSLHALPVDLDRLERISRGKVTFQKKLLKMFVENTEPSLEAIRKALLINDLATIEQQAHRLKGASANAGVRLIPEIAAQLEQQAKQKQLTDASEQLAALTHQLAQVKAFLENWQ
ncbi:MAG: response regulator [Kastovskya adunca ATA6-11-RM4]|jgi:PAS domain S-box-containing protein|nr:response regulator [Kastovskya adunca ATA6-11-RM4]